MISQHAGVLRRAHLAPLRCSPSVSCNAATVPCCTSLLTLPRRIRPMNPLKPSERDRLTVMNQKTDPRGGFLQQHAPSIGSHKASSSPQRCRSQRAAVKAVSAGKRRRYRHASLPARGNAKKLMVAGGNVTLPGSMAIPDNGGNSSLAVSASSLPFN